MTLPAYRIQWLARVLYGDPFEFFVIAVIIANAAALATLTFPGLDPTVARVAHTVDTVAIIFYTFELVLRIISYGKKPWMFFRNPWNVFDFIVVVAIPFLNNGTVIFRLVRLLRILRIFRFLPEARILMLSMVKSVAPLANLAVLIGFLMFIYGMAGVYLFGAADPERWGNIGQAILTLTIMLTLENFPDAFLSGLEITPFALVFFLTYMFFIVFTVLNVLIGIVLTRWTRRARRSRSRPRPSGCRGAHRTRNGAGGAPNQAGRSRGGLSGVAGSPAADSRGAGSAGAQSVGAHRSTTAPFPTDFQQNAGST